MFVVEFKLASRLLVSSAVAFYARVILNITVFGRGYNNVVSNQFSIGPSNSPWG
jgi:hypothetical protein